MPDGLHVRSAIAQRTVNALFGDLDQEALLQAALARRLRSDRPIADKAEFARLFRYLLAQGFESDEVMRALRARSVKWRE